MQKFFSMLVVAVLVTGLGALVSPAGAAPYPGTVATRTRLNPDDTTPRRRPVDVTFSVVANGNAEPRGTVTFKVFRKGELLRTFDRGYDGGRASTTIGRYKKAGRYRVRATFTPSSPDSVFIASKSPRKSFRVTR